MVLIGSVGVSVNLLIRQMEMRRVMGLCRLRLEIGGEVDGLL